MNVTFRYTTPTGEIEEAAFATLDEAAKVAWQRMVQGVHDEGRIGIVRIVDADGAVYDDDDMENLRLQREH